ncbi:MAG: 8-oxo-dGTP diphosphatase [Patescibacteria group bacterium]
MNKILTLCLIAESNRVLLGMKKRGFGAGKWNGFGGKVTEGESIEDAAKREVTEECGLIVESMSVGGILEFTFEGQDGILEVHLFRVDRWSGDVVESEEMRPRWFAIDEIPYSEMWPDDKFWLPAFLEGKTCNGAFHFALDRSIARQAFTIGE